MKRFLIVCSLGLICLIVKAQRMSSLLPAEEVILDLLARDTSAQVVTVLPMKYRFGIRNLTFDRISILKDGARILLLPDGNDAVFQWRADLRKLIRIDSSRFSGSNFGMMPFIRNGQAWQFGGYGFWRSRDVFTRFDEHSGEWELEYSDSSVTGHLTLYFYDPVSDAFYMCGSYRNRPHDMHRTDFSDFVFMFDFRQRKWSRLGKIALASNSAELMNVLPLRNTALFHSGLIHLMGSQSTLYDFRQNLYSRIRVGSDTALIRIGAQSGHYDRTWEHSLMLGDSLVIIHANDEQANIEKLYLKSEMFEPIGHIWSDKADLSIESSKSGLLSWIIFGLLSIGGCLFFLSSKLDVLKSIFRQHRMQTPAEPVNDNNVDWSVFRKGLRPGHQILLRYLAVEGDMAEGVAADAINNVLGISRRPPGLQKVHRNRAIQLINQIYQQTFRTKSILIERLKDPKDRRQTRYCIAKDKLHLIKQHIHS